MPVTKPGTPAPLGAECTLYDRSLIFGSIAFLAVCAAGLLLRQAFLTADQFFALAFVVALALGQTRRYLWDWTPVLLLILGYEYLRGIVPLINHHVHFHAMANFDRWLFGEVPSATLQCSFYDPQHLRWWDYAGTGLYLTHFFVPMLVAFAFWSTG